MSPSERGNDLETFRLKEVAKSIEIGKKEKPRKRERWTGPSRGHERDEKREMGNDDRSLRPTKVNHGSQEKKTKRDTEV